LTLVNGSPAHGKLGLSGFIQAVIDEWSKTGFIVEYNIGVQSSCATAVVGSYLLVLKNRLRINPLYIALNNSLLERTRYTAFFMSRSISTRVHFGQKNRAFDFTDEWRI
jgi:hypothetical protein